MLAVALENFDIDIIDIDTRRVVRKFQGHTSQITDATFSPDSRWLVTSSMDCSIRTWDVPTSQLIDQFATPVACISLDMSPSGDTLVTSHVDYLGIFLWTNRCLYEKITLKSQTPVEQPALIELPECVTKDFVPENEVKSDSDDDEFISPEQIQDLVTLSGLSSSRWQNLLSVDVIKLRNKPKLPPKTPKAAPFFLPTVQSLAFRFDLNVGEQLESGSKLLMPSSLINLTEFGSLLDSCVENDDFLTVVEKLKSFGPLTVDFEVKSLAPEGGGSVKVMLQFLKLIEVMLKSFRDFELAQGYLGVFLKHHGRFVAQEDVLRSYLPNVYSCSEVVWSRIQEKLLFSLCIVKNLKI